MNQMIPAPQTGVQQSNWMWDGQRWVCCPDDGVPFPCPPPSFPPVGCPPWFPPPQGQPPWYPGANAGVSFSQTAPPNPTRGHFWWNGSVLSMWDGAVWVTIGGAGGGGATGAGTVIISTSAPGNPQVGSQWWDGSVLRMWDGVTWNIIGPGASPGPVPTTTLSFAITQPGYFTAPSTLAGWDVVAFTSTPQVDTTLGWDSVTKKFTAKKAGVWMFDASLYQAGEGGLAIVKNDPGTFGNGQNDNIISVVTNSGGGYMDLSGMVIMNGTTDFIRLFGYSTAAQFWGASTPALSGWIMP